MTDSRIVKPALTLHAARENIAALVGRPHIRTAGESEEFWDRYVWVCESIRVAAKLVADAHIVALMHEHGIGTIWTHEDDFRRFPGITVRDPFAA